VIDFEAAFRFRPCELKEAIPDWYAVSCRCHWHDLREERSLTADSLNGKAWYTLRALQGNTGGSIGQDPDIAQSDTHSVGGQVLVGLDHSALEDGLVQMMAGVLGGSSVNVDQ
jgi:hypothetical protein